ncbi:MAG: HAMP domain-containing sensor histidine kinase, partial [Pseudomonadota bacterium]
QKHPLAKLFMLAYGVYVVSFSITISALMGFIPFNYFTFHASGLGLVIEALLFSYLLHFRVRLLEQELVQQKDRMILKNKKSQMGDMIAAITHQWKQPLTAISSIVTFLQYRLDDDVLIPSKELKPKLSQINEKVNFLVETIHDFRQFFKPDNIYEKTDIGQLIDRAVSLSNDDMLAAGITIKTDLKYTNKIRVYQNELLHIILNLIQNSKEAFKNSQVEFKLIKIFGFTQNDQIIIDFIDNAGGISVQHMPHIFDEFYTTKSKQDGTGLGLYLSKFILEQHMNGSIEANNLDNGVIFRIKILGQHEYE